MVLVLNDVTHSTEDIHIYRSLKRKFEKYNYLTIAENMRELDGEEASTGDRACSATTPSHTTKKFQYFTRKAKKD